MHWYTAYGLSIASELLLTNLPPASNKSDVVISLGNVKNLPVTSDASAAEDIRVTGDEIWCSSKGVARFLVKEGRELIVDPEPTADEANLRSTVLELGLPLLLVQRGSLVLHASSVAINDVAFILCGDSGSGKSALAFALYTLGCALVADDIVSIRFRARIPEVAPSYPEIGMWPDVLEYFGHDPVRFKKQDQTSEKRVYPVQGRFHHESLPLGGVYVLNNGSDTKIEPISKRQALRELDEQSWCICKSENPVDSTHFFQYADLVRTAEIRRLTVPRSLKRIFEVAHMVRAEAVGD